MFIYFSFLELDVYIGGTKMVNPPISNLAFIFLRALKLKDK